ncbi:unnamed protein product [Laminaria digitata]
MSPGAKQQVAVMSKAPSHRRGCILYLFLFMAYGCIGPFMPLIWRSKGLSEEHQVGLLGAITPISSFFVTPVLCAFADRHGIQQQMLYAAMGLFVFFRPSVLIARGFWAVGAVEALCSVSNSPIGSLVDSAVRHSFGGDGYGIQRLWGAVGFGVASLISGYLCDAAGGTYEGVMSFFVAVMIAALAASKGVPVGRRDDGPQDGKEGSESRGNGAHRREYGTGKNLPVVVLKPPPGCCSCVAKGARSIRCLVGWLVGWLALSPTYITQHFPPVLRFRSERLAMGDNDAAAWKTELVKMERASDGDAPIEGVVTSGPRSRFGQELHETSKSATREEDKVGVLAVVRVMLGTPHNATFFAAVGLSGMGAGVIDMFLFIRLEELGGSHVLCGLARLIMCLAEVPFFYLSGPLIRRVGVRGVVALTQLAYLTRFIYYSVLREPWWVLPAEVLHGLTFAAMWAATTDYAHDIAPAHMRTTIQGVVTGLHWGLGFGLGAVFGGVLYAGLGARLCFGVSAILPSLSLLLLSVPSARPWLSNFMGRCGVWTTAHWRGGDESAYELVQKEIDENGTEGFGRDDEERNGETDPSDVLLVGEEHTVDV